MSKKGARKGTPKRKSSAAVKRQAAKPAAKPLRRPPEVTAAEWKRWSPAYRKRAVSFYKNNPGAPRYRMRGKQAGESLTRRERLAERMAALAERQSYRGHDHGARSPAEIVASYQALVRAEGERAFSNTERLIRERQKGQGRITADELGYDWDDYDGEDSELFYN